MKILMRSALYVIVAITLATHTVRAQDTLFQWAEVTDTHVNAGNPTAAEDLRRTVADINRQPRIAFVILSGDITEFGSDVELLQAKSILDSLNKPWYIIPGNHDANWSESGCNSFRKIFGDETFSFEYRGYWFVGTGCGPNMRMGPGQIPTENIVWLDKQLKAHPNKQQPVFFVNHYPQDSTLNNWYEVLDRFHGRNLKAVLCGHGHRNKKFDFEGIPGIMCRSNLRAKNAWGGYNLVSFVGDSLHFNERTPNGVTHPAWDVVCVQRDKMPTWEPHPFRPDYSMNKTYPGVKERWRIQEPGDIGSAFGMAGNLAVYSNTNGLIKAIDDRSGKRRWQFQTGGKIYSTPYIYQNTVVVPSTDQEIYALDLKTGRLQWSYKTGKAIVASPVGYKNQVIVAGSDGHCRSLDIKTGKLVWDFDSVVNFVKTRPLVYHDKVYFGSWGNDFYALDARTGRRVWTWNAGYSNRMYSPASCWPVANGDRIFIVAPDRYMTVLNSETGAVIWRFHDPDNWVRESMGQSTDSSLVYVKTMQGHILAFSAQSDVRKVVWKSPVELGYDICPSRLIEYKGMVLVPTQSGAIYALSAKDGSLLWKHKISNCLVNTIRPIGHRQLLVSTMDGKVVCLSYPG